MRRSSQRQQAFEGEGAGVIPLDASNIVAETLAGEWARLGRADLLPGPGRGYAGALASPAVKPANWPRA